MKRASILLALLITAVCLVAPSQARRYRYSFFHPRGSFAIEVSLQNSPYLRLPMYRNSITSLAVVGDHIIGGTSAKAGLSPFIFVASLSGQKMTNIVDVSKVVPGQRDIRSGFSRAKDNTLYAGTIPNDSHAAGHLLRIELSPGQIKVLDLGSPVAGQGIFALAPRPVNGKLYGITYPSGDFFSYDLKTGKAKTYDAIAPSGRDRSWYWSYNVTPMHYLSRRLAVDAKGRIYGSEPFNRIFRFDPATQKFKVLGELPTVWGRNGLGRVDSWAVAADGTIYGGNGGDGDLFKIDPATGKIINLGKPAMMPRLKALAFAGNGKLYGVAGGRPGYAHLFSYDPKTGNFADMGNPQFDMTAPNERIGWRGFQLDTMATSDDGKYVVMGEDEALSQLMVFPVK